MEKRIYQILIFCFLCTGCAHKNREPASHVGTVTVNMRHDKSERSLDDFFDFSRFVFLETNDESLLGKIDKLQIIGDRIYILDGISKVVFVFDGQGRFVRKLDKAGRANNEYMEINDMEATAGGTILIYDGLSGKLLCYDSTGVLVNKQNMPLGDGFKLLPDDRIAFNFGNGAGTEENNESMYNYACFVNDSILYRDIPFNPALAGRRFAHGLGKSVFYLYENNVYMSSQLNDTIYAADQSGGIKPVLAYDFGSERPTLKQSDKSVMGHVYQVLDGEAPSAPFCFYRHDSVSMVLYNYNKQRRAVISDASNRVVCQGFLGQDKNGLTFNPVPFIDSDNLGFMISAIVTPNLELWRKRASEKGKSTELLDQLAARIGTDSNPVLVFYDWAQWDNAD